MASCIDTIFDANFIHFQTAWWVLCRMRCPERPLPLQHVLLGETERLVGAACRTRSQRICSATRSGTQRLYFPVVLVAGFLSTKGNSFVLLSNWILIFNFF